MTLIPSAEHNLSRADEQLDEKQSEHEDHPVRISSTSLVRPLRSVALAAAWKPTILVVDDSPMNRKMLIRMLVSKGFACREAEDGMEGLSEMSRMYLKPSVGGSGSSYVNPASHRLHPTLRASSIRFSQQRLASSQKDMSKEVQPEQHNYGIDAVLIDSNMPRMNGPEAIVEMRKMGFRGLIIGVSGGDEKTMKEFMKAGAENVMQKPVQSNQLVDLVFTGLDLIVQEAISSYQQQSLIEGHQVSASQQAWHEHILRLRQFIEEKLGAAVKK